MKKVLLPLMTLLVFAGALNAQDAAAAFKEAKKAFGKYKLEENQEKQAELLQTARQNIDIATADASTIGEKERFKLWETKSSIYNNIAQSEINQKVLKPDYKFAVPTAASDGFAAVNSALEVSEKKWQKKLALDALFENANHLINFGSLLYGDGDYAGAYGSFKKVLEARKMLVENGKNEFLPTDEEYQDQIYTTALSASAAGEADAAKAYYTQLYEMEYQKPAVYNGLFMATVDDDETKALEILENGRQKFPEDEGLLVSEINHYLKVGKLNELVSKLEKAIETDPSNVSYISTLGQVYDNLQQREMEAGNADKANEYTESAMKYYNMALEQDPGFFQAIYNLGALYYNKAAILNKEMIALDGDYSKTGLAKFEAKKKEVLDMFNIALPYFKDAEKLAPSDIGTLTALKEIYARTDDFETSNEFKNRLEKIQQGETIETSYFK